MNLFIEGFLLQASLILALGAQNIFVLESGLKKRRHITVAFVCSVCDTILLVLGVAGAATIFVKIPYLKMFFGVVGVLFLAFYGVKKIQEFQKGDSNINLNENYEVTLKKVILLSLGFSLLNPHVYLDTIILIGGYSSKFPLLSSRLLFGFGAASFSTIWFFSLAIFAMMLSQVLKKPKVMGYVSLISGIILLILSFKLGQDVYKWMV